VQASPTGVHAGSTGPQTGQAGAKTGQTGSLTGQVADVAAVLPQAVSPAPIVASAAVGDFPATISACLRAIGWKIDIYRDYIHFLTGSPFDAVMWRLASSATSVNFSFGSHTLTVVLRNARHWIVRSVVKLNLILHTGVLMMFWLSGTMIF
jgi:hypothetical protein